MNNLRVLMGSMIVAGLVLVTTPAFSADITDSTVGAGGYDVVAYFTEGAAKRGTGWHVAEYNGTTYLFSSKKNRKAFMKSPENYLPQYGGYCAYGVAVGKKFYADPTLWKVVDGKLYLNLDQKIQKTFEKDIPGNIVKADTNWPKVQNEDPAGL